MNKKFNVVSSFVTLDEQVAKPVGKQVLVTCLGPVLEGASTHTESLMYDGRMQENRVAEFSQRADNNPAYKANCCVVSSWLRKWNHLMKPDISHSPTVTVKFLLL